MNNNRVQKPLTNILLVTIEHPADSMSGKPEETTIIGDTLQICEVLNCNKSQVTGHFWSLKYCDYGY